jgi:exopolysaccharide production protein ExoQ
MESSLIQPHQRFLRRTSWLLVIILFIMIGGFFTWSENVAVTRVIKVASRMFMVAAVFAVQQSIVKRGAVASFTWKNRASILLYVSYLGLGLVSLLWSTNPGYSALQWFMDAQSLFFALLFIQCFILLDRYFSGSGIRFYAITGNAIFLMILIFVVGMFTAPDEFYRMTHGGEEARLGGYFMNPNELGMLCALGVSCLLFDLYGKTNKVWTIIKVLVLVYALIMTGSRSSTIGLLLIFFFHIRRSDNKKLKIAMYVGAILAVPVAIEKIMIKEGGGGLDEVMSMTGRLPFWEALLTEGLPKEPFFGFGFMRIAYKDYFQGVHTYAGQMTHNTFIQVLMNLGFVGFTIVLFQLVFAIRGFIKTIDQEKRLMFFGMMIPLLINSFTEFGIFGETNYGILFYQLIVVYISRDICVKLTSAEQLYMHKKRPEWFSNLKSIPV